MATFNSKFLHRSLLLAFAACSIYFQGCVKAVDHVEGPTTVVMPVSDNTAPTNSDAFAVSDIFNRASMPVMVKTTEKGIVCLGEQPEILNLDTAIEFRSLQPTADHPKLLNLQNVTDRLKADQLVSGKASDAKIKVVVLVDESGKVIRFKFPDPIKQELQDLVALRAEELLFEPGKNEGKAAKWWVIVPIYFGKGGC